MIDRLFQQNADLVVMPSANFHSSQSGPAYLLDLAAFTNAADLVQWEFSAYESYGQDRCDVEKIETLTDLFGPAFEKAFRARHRVLLAELRNVDLRVELMEIQVEIARNDAIINSNGVETRSNIG